MPYKDPLKAKENKKQYYLANKEKIAKYHKQYFLDNTEKIKQYYLDNPKINIISEWKRQGVIDNDWDSLYEYFIKETNCWICDKVFNKDINMDRRCLDHDHDLLDEPNVRYICCNYCNLHIIK